MIPDVAILAGGLATRLGDIAKAIPKSLLEIAGRPFLFHQFDLLEKEGVRKVVICAGHLAGRISEAVSAGRPWSFDVGFSIDGPALLGTGGAIIQALDKLSDPFFVIYGDSYLPVSLFAAADAFPPEALSLMAVFKNDGRFDKSNVYFESGRILVYNKKKPTTAMRHIDYGLNIFRKAAFDEAPRKEAFDLSDLQTQLARRGKLAGWESAERFCEIGSKAGLEELRKMLSKCPEAR